MDGTELGEPYLAKTMFPLATSTPVAPRATGDVATLLVSAVSLDSTVLEDGVASVLPCSLPSVARFNRVAPAVYRMLAGSGSTSTDVVSALRVDAARHAETRLRMTADLAWLADSLRPLGVPWSVVKGPVLDLLWPQPGLRQYHDLDVLVPRSAFAEVLVALERGGAVLVDRNWPLIAARRYSELTLALPHGTSLDLHWDLVWDPGRRGRTRLPTEALLCRRVPVTPLGTAATTLDPADTLLHVALHTANAGAYRLAWMKDVESCAHAPGLDWSVVAGRAADYGLDLTLAVVLARAQRTLPGFAVPAVAVEPALGLWGRLAESVDRWCPVPVIDERQRTGRHLYCSTDRTTVASLSRSILTANRVLPGLRRRNEQPSVDPLHLDRPDPQARLRYLGEVTSGVAPRP